jgi:hypothetical protein
MNPRMDYFRNQLAGELMASAAQPALPDAIRVVMLMSTPAGFHGPFDSLPQGFAPPVAFRPSRYDDLIEGEAFDVDSEPRSRGGRRGAPGHVVRSRSGLRCLLPRPGVKRSVCFGEFKSQLSAQLAHPERLRDTHRLPCCVQLYRVVNAQPRTDIARRLFGARASASDLLMFTPDVARRLQLPPPRNSQPDESTRESPWLNAGEEVVELRVIHDHTQHPVREESAEVPRERTPDAPKEVKPLVVKPPVVIPPVEAATPAPAVRTVIPARFLMSPDFQLTREEALFDMTVAASARGAFAGLRRIARAFLRRGELTRWRALLDGCERDEQLWQIRPPKVALTDARSRDWVRRALTRGGYDTEHMLREWELYWRRRGV